MTHLVFKGKISKVTEENKRTEYSFMLDVGDREIWVKPTPTPEPDRRPSVGDEVEIEGNWAAPINEEAARNPMFGARVIGIIKKAKSRRPQ